MSGFPKFRILTLASMLLGCTVQSALGVRWYVKADAAGANTGQDWASAFTELQSALAVAAAGDEMWIASGTYRPDYDTVAHQHTGNRSARFVIAKGLSLIGGFHGDEPPAYDPATRNIEANPTVLSGDLAGNDVANLAGALQCFSGPTVACDAGCIAYDSDFDGDVDSTDLAMNDNANRMVFVNNPGQPVILDGLVIRGGCFESTALGSQGIGLSNYSGNVTLRHCRIEANVANTNPSQGGAIFNGGGLLVADHCTISSNIANGTSGAYGVGGGLYATAGVIALNDCRLERNCVNTSGGAISIMRFVSMQATDCVFDGNRSTQWSGAVDENSIDARYTRCMFVGNQANWGGGIFHTENTAVIDCEFRGNKATTGGAVQSYGCTPKYYNCLFTGNLASDRGGAWMNRDAGTPLIVNCTFSGNHALDRTGGIHSNTDGGVVTLVGCILWGNTDVSNGGGRGAQFSGIKDVTYSCFEGGVAGDFPTVIDRDPLFEKMPSPGDDSQWATADDDYGDLHLQDRSPCIDAASNEPLQTEAITTDLDGAPRFVEHGGVFDKGAGVRPVADMGAYENPGDCNSNGIPDEVDTDSDNDGLIDGCDNCPADANSDQADLDSDDVGNVCDDDVDGDGTPNSLDGCPLDPNFTNEDTDGDGTLDCYDLCPQDANKVAPGTCGCNVADADSDNDGVADCNDACAGTLAGAAVGADGCPVVRADQDRDGDVDQADFGLFQICLNGPTTPQTDPKCSRARLNSDAYVDAADTDLFMNCFSGPDVSADPACQQ